MNIKKIAKLNLDKLVELGAEKASVWVNRNFRSELQKEFNGIDLFRDVDAIEIELRVINDDREGSHSYAYSGEDDIGINARKVMKIASESNQDKAFAMAENQHFQNKYGIETANPDKMYDLLAEFDQERQKIYPQITDTTSIVFNREEVCYLNNLNSEVEYSNGFYEILSLLSATQDGKHSSINFVVESCTELPESIMGIKNFKLKYDDVVWQMEQEEFKDKFVGDVIINPLSLASIIGNLSGEIEGLSLVEKTSLFQDKLNQKIFDEKLSILGSPDYPQLVNKNIINREGYLNREDFIIEKGILKNFIVSEYVANRSEFEVNTVANGNMIISPGQDKLEDMIKSIKKGILINRLSFGRPNKNKDFSAVVKTSYYIENGEIKYPINEVMISANLVDMLNNIQAISQERDGSMGSILLPWMKISGVNISGK
ncbi:hypothetical protein JEZ13_10320 [bacterium]|nr:hypothetical protein [bacterium]